VRLPSLSIIVEAAAEACIDLAGISVLGVAAST
jgi:hypothetical protein